MVPKRARSNRLYWKSKLKTIPMDQNAVRIRNVMNIVLVCGIMMRNGKVRL